MNRLARFFILAAVSFVLGLYVTPAGFRTSEVGWSENNCDGLLAEKR